MWALLHTFFLQNCLAILRNICGVNNECFLRGDKMPMIKNKLKKMET
jgi:hypothetical protein